MVEGAIAPLHGIVTVRAGGRESRRHVVHGSGRVVVVSLMAAYTSGGQRRVVIVGMAIGAGSRRHRMRSGERERSVVVIEGRVGPEHGVVAHLASGRETRVRHRRGRIVEIRLVARNA